MLLVLPPKRFQSPQDPIFDPVRHYPWFGRLEARRTKILFLRAAYEAWKRDGKLQKVAAETYGVDERELRDFANFKEGVRTVPEDKSKTFQAILDDACSHYWGDGGRNHLRHYIETIAPFYGLKARHVTEAWEVDRLFLPTGS